MYKRVKLQQQNENSAPVSFRLSSPFLSYFFLLFCQFVLFSTDPILQTPCKCPPALSVDTKKQPDKFLNYGRCIAGNVSYIEEEKKQH